MISAEASLLAAYERELQIARRIQASFLPEAPPRLPGWEINAFFRPALLVAGDFYDVMPMNNRRRLGLVLADVCDKGVGAALFMALFRTLIRAFAQQHHALRWADMLTDPTAPAFEGRHALPSAGDSALRNALALTNAYLLDNHAESGMFATIFFGVLDPQTGALSYVNGGQTPPLLAGKGQIKARLGPTGPAVGLLPEADWEIQHIQMDPDDVLLAYTDGVTEARDPNGGFYGEPRLQALVRGLPNASAAELTAEVAADVDCFTDTTPQTDDITMLTIRRSEESP